MTYYLRMMILAYFPIRHSLGVLPDHYHLKLSSATDPSSAISDRLVQIEAVRARLQSRRNQPDADFTVIVIIHIIDENLLRTGQDRLRNVHRRSPTVQLLPDSGGYVSILSPATRLR